MKTYINLTHWTNKDGSRDVHVESYNRLDIAAQDAKRDEEDYIETLVYEGVQVSRVNLLTHVDEAIEDAELDIACGWGPADMSCNPEPEYKTLYGEEAWEAGANEEYWNYLADSPDHALEQAGVKPVSVTHFSGAGHMGAQGGAS